MQGSHSDEKMLNILDQIMNALLTKRQNKTISLDNCLPIIGTRWN